MVVIQKDLLFVQVVTMNNCPIHKKAKNTCARCWENQVTWARSVAHTSSKYGWGDGSEMTDKEIVNWANSCDDPDVL